ncbi:hypothetical protein PLUA15_80026 [Pseudomonas lundensis]|uniref:Uncharacterized protein n=1 Tax=Pseudomonas lundensis TaxID=86185 RepID=A0AAX2HFY3_9PSED|nr:hypothetical protein PLUA15_80026 [Pseudomonas lundensis]
MNREEGIRRERTISESLRGFEAVIEWTHATQNGGDWLSVRRDLPCKPGLESV